MGTSRIVPLIIKADSNMERNGFFGEWHTRDYGKPTPENLNKWRQRQNKSFLPGGVNEHLSTSYIPHISNVRVYRQSPAAKRGLVASYIAPAFEIV